MTEPSRFTRLSRILHWLTAALVFAALFIGFVMVNSVEHDANGNARDINFDPLVLPPGIDPSDDPLLSARSAVYAASYRRRTGEDTL